MDISVVLPTSKRAPALRHTFPLLRALDGVDEIIVVPDGPGDPAVDLLQGTGDSRVRFEPVPPGSGSPAARNAGARLASGRWILFAEDDCGFPPDFAVILRSEAADHRADIAGAPMVRPLPGEHLEEVVERARRRGGGSGGLDAIAGFHAGPELTPLLPAASLVHRRVFRRLEFDEGFRGNAYREETDFFVRARRAGFRCLLTPRTYFWQAGRWPGGNHTGPVRDELWRLRNNWRFLRRHGPWLRSEGYIRSPLAEEIAFLGRRLRILAAESAQRSPRRGSGASWTKP
jgi:GT2 family glycosyltransferase